MRKKESKKSMHIYSCTNGVCYVLLLLLLLPTVVPKNGMQLVMAMATLS
jgi:hypothetical protein